MVPCRALASSGLKSGQTEFGKPLDVERKTETLSEKQFSNTRLTRLINLLRRPGLRINASASAERVGFHICFRHRHVAPVMSIENLRSMKGLEYFFARMPILCRHRKLWRIAAKCEREL